MKSILVSAAALAALAAGAAWAAAPAAAMQSADHHARRSAHAPVNRSLTVLFDQSGDGGSGTISQDFDSSSGDDLDDQAGDDFTVPAGHTWAVREIDAPGRYFTGSGAPSVNVFIYFHAKGTAVARVLPGNLRKEFDNLPTGDDGFGNFTITLPRGVRLRPGTYFLSVQANEDPSTESRWAWENTDGKKGLYRAVWRNPAGGFGFDPACQSWHRNDECTGNVDMMFTLRGDLQ